MLRSTHEIKDYRINAIDGELGRARDFLVDDYGWVVRYLVVDTGTWFPKEKVLLSPGVLGRPDGETQVFPVNLTKSQLEDSPRIDTAPPVSLSQRREALSYGWMALITSPAAATGAAPAAVRFGPPPLEGEPEVRLRSLEEVRKYSVEGLDDSVGRVDDFIVDDQEWIVRYIVIDTGGFLQKDRVILAPGWVDRIDWGSRTAFFDLKKEVIEAAPPFNPSTPVNRTYEIELYDYYGRPVYWS